MSPARLLAAYRLLFSALIIVASVQTLRAAAAEHAVVLLATAEIIGALLLCWRRTQWPGAALLLLVFACAQLLSALQGDWPIRFLLYAASALLIVMMDRSLVQSSRAERGGLAPRADGLQ